MAEGNEDRAEGWRVYIPASYLLIYVVIDVVHFVFANYFKLLSCFYNVTRSLLYVGRNTAVQDEKNQIMATDVWLVQVWKYSDIVV